jgi:hypothetical protein
MWRAVIVLMVVLVSWTTADALVCPDGCADSAAGATLSSVHGTGCCILCHGGFTADSYTPALLPGPSISEPVVFVTTDGISSSPTRIEHPPRA